MKNFNPGSTGTFRFLALAMLLGAPCLGGCSGATYPGEGELHGQRILFAGTPAYNEQAGKLKLSPDEAEQAALGISKWTWGKPKLLVGRSYVFSPDAMAFVSLDGVYVDGDSGTAHYLASEYVVERDLFGNPAVTPRAGR